MGEIVLKALYVLGEIIIAVLVFIAAAAFCETNTTIKAQVLDTAVEGNNLRVRIIYYYDTYDSIDSIEVGEKCNVEVVFN